MFQGSVFIVLAAAAADFPAGGKPPPPTPVSSNPSPSKSAVAVDQERLILAREIALAIWPNGTAQKMMAPMMDARTGMVTEMMKTSPKDLGAKGGGKDDDKTLGDLVHEKDPYFEQRLAIVNRVMGEEVGKLMSQYEPQLRESMAELYAKRFSKAELSDIAAFYRTPSGKSYAAQLIPMMADPEYGKAVSSLAPKIMQAMPAIAARIKKETDRLPPPKTEAPEKALPST